MTNTTITTGDIVHKTVSSMRHGIRPCVVIGITDGWAHLVPLSSDAWGDMPYLRANGGVGGHPCPNRYHKASAEGLTATDWMTDEDTARVWDTVFA